MRGGGGRMSNDFVYASVVLIDIYILCSVLEIFHAASLILMECKGEDF